MEKEMKPDDIAVLQHIAEFETQHPDEYPSGWTWQMVKVWAATLNRLLAEDYVEVVFHSNNFTGYRLTEKAKSLLAGMEKPVEDDPQGPLELPADLFAGVIGHDEVKELLTAAISALRPVHVLLAGPPALAKSIFLWDLERTLGERACWFLGSSASRAGLLEMLLQERPRVALIDELDKLDREDQAVLLSVMEGGRLVRTKVGRMADALLDVRVVAACNRPDRLSPELRSRFAIRRLRAYTGEEYRRVVVGVLVKREECPEETAQEIAARLQGLSQDVRDAVRVARLAPQLGVEKAVRLLMEG